MLRPKPNPNSLHRTDFADDFLRQTKILNDTTMKIIMLSNSKYEETYNLNATAAPSQFHGYCFILPTFADNQGSKNPFCD